MPVPRVRFTVRRMMVAVAVLAILLGVYGWVLRLRRMSVEFLAEARRHADMEQVLRTIIGVSGRDSFVDISPGPGVPSRRTTAGAVAEHEAALGRKYERAARYPWLSVAPGPPEPE